jgi:23S rRNA (pseudouridine1915-N3)-methyltransferase
MRLIVVGVGKLKNGPERQLFEHYKARVGSFARSHALGALELIEISESRAASRDQRKKEEGLALLSKCPTAFRVVLDESGRTMTSRAFAEFIQKQRDDNTGAIAFLIGGADGHGPVVRDSGALSLSLGAMTLPHGLARVVLAEQLYRAATVIAGHPYHRD